MPKVFKKLFPLLVFGFMSLTAMAQSYKTADGDSINPRFYFQAGAFFPVMNTSMRVNSERGFGTEISLENDLKMQTEITVFRIAGLVRAKQRSQFAVSFTEMNRSKTRIIDRDITIGDTTFDANASLKVKFDVDYYALTWRYSFFNKINWNAGLSFGLRMVQFKTGFESSRLNHSYESNPAFLVPAILIGVHGSGYLTPKLLGRYSLEYLQLSVSNIDLNILEAQVSLIYYITKNFGVGGGYANSAYNASNLPLSKGLEGNVDFSFQGFTLFASARF